MNGQGIKRTDRGGMTGRDIRITTIAAALLLAVLISGCNGGPAASKDATTAAVQTEQTGDAADTGTPAESTASTEAAAEPEDTEPAKVRIVDETVTAESLGSNMLEEGIEQRIKVVLPPSYDTDMDKRYPVVYFLHGFQENIGLFGSITESLSKQMQSEGVKEFIIVEPNGRNTLGGAFYANSPVTGNWEDYIIKDIIGYIDGKYRTIPDAAQRGLAGFSMGGFGALNLGLKHPDVFSSLMILSPGAFDQNGLKNAMPTWDASFLQAYGAAFSPNVKGEYPYANIPKFDNTKADNKIVADWENGFGNLKGKIEAYQALNKPLKAIYISYGSLDSYPWIPEGSAYFSRLLTEAGIQHEDNVFNGGHEIASEVIRSALVKFFSENLN